MPKGGLNSSRRCNVAISRNMKRRHNRRRFFRACKPDIDRACNSLLSAQLVLSDRENGPRCKPKRPIRFSLSADLPSICVKACCTVTMNRPSCAPRPTPFSPTLAQNIGRVVPKSELMDSVWPGIYVTEDSLTQSIREIRKVLGDDKQELIRTISRRGYMLAVAAEPVADAGIQPIVAVLRFRNETGDAAQVPLVDGFAEDIINGLARFGTVTVLARNSSFSLSSESKSDWSLARARIGADYLVEGSIRRHGKRLRVSVSLVDAANLVQLWGERYDADGDEIFSIQEDIIERIIGRLVTRLEDARSHPRGA